MKRIVTTLAALVLAVPVLYVLASGPAQQWYLLEVGKILAGEAPVLPLAAHHRLKNRMSAIATLYTPLDWLAKQSPWAGSVYYWYVGLWEPGPVVTTLDLRSGAPPPEATP